VTTETGPSTIAGLVAERTWMSRVRALFLGGNDVTLPVFMYTQTRFPQTLPTVLALGSCIFMGSAILLGTAEWLRRMGAQPMKNTAT